MFRRQCLHCVQECRQHEVSAYCTVAASHLACQLLCECGEVALGSVGGLLGEGDEESLDGLLLLLDWCGGGMLLVVGLGVWDGWDSRGCGGLAAYTDSTPAVDRRL